MVATKLDYKSFYIYQIYVIFIWNEGNSSMNKIQYTEWVISLEKITLFSKLELFTGFVLIKNHYDVPFLLFYDKKKYRNQCIIRTKIFTNK